MTISHNYSNNYICVCVRELALGHPNCFLGLRWKRKTQFRLPIDPTVDIDNPLLLPAREVNDMFLFLSIISLLILKNKRLYRLKILFILFFLCLRLK